MVEMAMSFLNAAISILKETRRDMTANEVAQIAMDRGLVKSTGKTPGATLAAQLYVHVREHPQGPLRKVSVPGPSRARRDSVKWAWRD
jgi:hypothetical protein